MCPSYQSPNSKGRLLIFDFDGVLADSFDTFYPLMRDVMKHVGLSLTPDQYRNFFVDNVHQSIKNFINDENKYALAMEFRNSNYDRHCNEESHKAKLFPGAVEFLKEIGKNYILTIASSGREDNIKNLLEKNCVKNLFGLILANTATSKAGMIKETLNKFQAIPKETIMLTDTVGDIDIAKKCGLKTIAVTWGFHSAKILKSSKPNFIVNNFNELINYLN